MLTQLTNARLANGEIVDLVLDEGLIAKIDPSGSLGPAASEQSREQSQTVHDLGGWLLLPGLVEPHAHLDKALSAEAVPNPSGDLRGAIDAWNQAAATGMFSHQDIVTRATEAMKRLLPHGVTAVRTHVNVGADVGASSVLAVREAADKFAGILEVQIVALTNSPMTGPMAGGNLRALDEAVEAGVDLVGGCPHLDPDGAGLIRHCLGVAASAGIGIDLHVDEMLDPEVLFLPTLAKQVIDSGFEHSVAASHCVSLGVQPAHVAAEVAALVAQAQITVIPLPQTNLFLQGRDHPIATPRGLTALDALGEAGVLLAAGADNVQDPFNLVGRSDPLETAALLVMAGHRLPDDAFEMVSNNGRKAMGLDPVEMKVGDPADFLAIDAPSIRGAISDAPMSRRVFKAGRLVASLDSQATISFDHNG